MRELTYREWRQVAEEVESIYKKAHSSFALIGTDSLTMKVKRCWKKLLHFQKSSHESRARSSFVSQTKELFEVLKCRCRMEKSMEGDVTVRCRCPYAHRIPIIERQFVYAQRHRGSKAPLLGIGGGDTAVTGQLQRAAERQVNKTGVVQ